MFSSTYTVPINPIQTITIPGLPNQLVPLSISKWFPSYFHGLFPFVKFGFACKRKYAQFVFLVDLLQLT